MRLIIVFVLLFGAYYTFVISGDCGSHKYSGRFICSRNGNSKLNITFDCRLNNYTGVVEWIWSPSNADEMEISTVQNCEKVELLTKFPPKVEVNSSYRIDPKNDFQYLRLVNVSILSITDSFPNEWDTKYKKISYENGFLSEYYNRPCSLKHLIIENVQDVQIDNFFHDCFKRKGEFKSLKLINVNIKNLNIENLKLEELVMKNVTVHEAGANVFRLNGPGVVKITNSHFIKIKKNFVVGSANEVTISNNLFDKLYGKVFALDAEKITLNHNNIEVLPDDSLSFTSNNIQITDNIFHRIDQNAFRLISGASEFADSKSYKFSNNVIYSLAEGALNIAPQKSKERNYFSELIITNNEINCVCENKNWFDSVAKKKTEIETNQFYNKWAKNKYENECLNIPNCPISQVLKNYEELCNYNYKCFDDGQSNCMSQVLKSGTSQERILNSFWNNSIQHNQNTSDLFQNLFDRVEKESLKNSEKDERMKNYINASDKNFKEISSGILSYGNVSNKNFRETQKEISKLISHVNASDQNFRKTQKEISSSILSHVNVSDKNFRETRKEISSLISHVNASDENLRKAQKEISSGILSSVNVSNKNFRETQKEISSLISHVNASDENLRKAQKEISSSILSSVNVSNKNFRETQEEISNLRSHVNINQICLVVITILFCLTFTYLALAKILKLPFFNASILKSGTYKLRDSGVFKTEDDSSVTELMMNTI